LKYVAEVQSNVEEDQENEKIKTLMEKIPKAGKSICSKFIDYGKSICSKFIDYTIKQPFNFATNCCYKASDTFIIKPIKFCVNTWIDLASYSIGLIRRSTGQ